MSETRTLIVTEKSVITTGTGKHGDWTLYKLTATTPDGKPIAAELRAFADVEIGKPVEYEIEKQDYKGAEQFLLKMPKKRGAALGPKVDELRARVDGLEAAVEELKAQLAARSGAPVPKAAAASGGGDDVPYF